MSGRRPLVFSVEVETRFTPFDETYERTFVLYANEETVCSEKAEFSSADLYDAEIWAARKLGSLLNEKEQKNA